MDSESVDMSTLRPDVLLYLKHRAQPVKRILSVLKDILTDVNILFRPTEMYIGGVDPEKLVAVEVTLMHFEQYSCVEPNLHVGVYLSYLYKMLRGVGKNHIIEMTIERSTPHVLGILVTDVVKNTRSFTAIKSMELPLETVDIPTFAFDACASVPMSELQKALRETCLISKKVCLGYTPDNRIQLVASGPVGVANISIGPSDEGMEWHKKAEDGAHGLYFTKFIEKFIKPDVSATVDIGFAKDQPLMFSYSDKDYLCVFRFAVAEIKEPL